MAREVINVGAAPNDGTGDPIRTAYIKCNTNFGELYARVQTNPPPTLIGTPGDVAGMYAYDSNYFYYCFHDYDGSSIIWGQLGGSTPVALNNGTSNVAVAASGPVTFGVAGVANAAVVTAQDFSAIGNIIAGAGITASADITTTGDISATNLNISGDIGVTGNITVGNLIPAANVTYDLGSATAAWRDLYLSGNTIYLDAATITANATAMTLTTASGASFVVGGTGGNSTASFGAVQVTGNVAAANIVATNNITATGNVAGTYVFGDGSFLTNVTATANVAVTQISNGTSSISVVGTNGYGRINVAGVANVAVFTSAGTYIQGVLEATGNIQGGNITSIGNITADYFLGDGSQLTNLPVTYGNANVAVYLPTYTGNLAGSLLFIDDGVGNTWTMSDNILTAPSGGQWRSELDTEDDYITSAANGFINLQSLFADGNIASELHLEHGIAQIRVADSPFVEWSFLNTGELTAPGNITTTASVNGDIGFFNDVIVNNAGTNALLYTNSNREIYDTDFNYDIGNNAISGSGNITAGFFIGDGSQLTNVPSTYGNANVAAYLETYTGNVSVSNIVNANANGVGNIGSSTTYFNTIFAQATSAQYADLAEYYLSDHPYEPGTVLKFGGIAEVTVADTDADPTIVGVVSTAPAYIMNAKIVGQHSVAVALMGRVPVKVRGPVRRGQMLVSAGDGYARAEDAPPTGTVIGKAVKDFNGEVGVVEVVVGRL